MNSQIDLFQIITDVIPIVDINKQLISEIRGLEYITEFINPKEEKKLIQLVDKQTWLTDLKRRVQHYGYKYDYKARSVNHNMKLGELPDWLKKYSNRLYSESLFELKPDQVIINE